MDTAPGSTGVWWRLRLAEDGVVSQCKCGKVFGSKRGHAAGCTYTRPKVDTASGPADVVGGTKAKCRRGRPPGKHGPYKNKRVKATQLQANCTTNENQKLQAMQQQNSTFGAAGGRQLVDAQAAQLQANCTTNENQKLQAMQQQNSTFGAAGGRQLVDAQAAQLQAYCTSNYSQNVQAMQQQNSAIGAAGAAVPTTSKMTAGTSSGATSAAAEAKANASKPAGVGGAALLVAHARAAAPPKRRSPSAKITMHDNLSPAGKGKQKAGLKIMTPGLSKEFPAGTQPRHAAGLHGTAAAGAGHTLNAMISLAAQMRARNCQSLSAQQAALLNSQPMLPGLSPLAGFGGVVMPMQGMPRVPVMPAGMAWMQQQPIQQQPIQQQPIQQQQAAMNAGLFAAGLLGIQWGSFGLGGLGGLGGGVGSLKPSPQLTGPLLETPRQQLARHQQEQTQLLARQLLARQAAAQGALATASFAAGARNRHERPAIRGQCRLCGCDVLYSHPMLKDPVSGIYQHKDCQASGGPASGSGFG